ncbi:MAG: hypothetical protein HYX86_03815 [Chloroflexi bacterium]|nr:hypothetical protein [Chloroflexota bacterium]
MGYLLLNKDIPGSDGETILKMERNDWVVAGNLDDLEVAPSGRNITISAPAKNLNIFLQFKDLKKDRFRQDVEERAHQGWLQSQKMLEGISPKLSSEEREKLARAISTSEDSAERWWKQINEAIRTWPALEVTIEGHLPWPRPLLISPGVTTLETHGLFGDLTIIGGKAIEIC